jgi:hypothetical protein
MKQPPTALEPAIPAESDYDKWIREEAEAALAEADDPNTEWIPHEVVVQTLLKEKARIEARIRAENASQDSVEACGGERSDQGDPVR